MRRRVEAVPPVAVGNSRRHFERDGLGTAMQPWEDGARTIMAPGTFEWWYFDVHADDGTLIVVIFFTKPMIRIDQGAAPFVNVRILTPDGVTRRVEATTDPSSFRAAHDHCDVTIGANRVYGDLTGYHLTIRIDSVRCDLTFYSTSPPWRPGTGKMYFGSNEERYFAWIAPMPTGLVTGEYEIEGNRRSISGNGYHDHNWGTIAIANAWSRWWWSRSRIADYTVLAAELTASPAFGERKLNLLMIAKDDRIVVEDTESTKLTCHDTSFDRVSRKNLAKRLTFQYEDKGSSVTMTLNQNQQIFRHGFLCKSPMWKQLAARLIGLNPWYYRFSGNAMLNITHDGHSFSGKGEAIYELMSTVVEK